MSLMPIQQQDDGELVELTLKGDDAAYAALVNRYLPQIFPFVSRLLGNTRDAEDAAQETFVKAWRKLSSYDRERSFRTWLFAVAHNTAFDFLRKRRESVFSDFETLPGDNPLLDSMTDDEMLPDEQVLGREAAEEMELLLGKIPPLYREVLALHYYNGFTFEEIGAVLKKPLNTVKSQHRRGLALLRKLVDAPN